MTVTVNDIMALMQNLAPARLAESWDNVGLQVGDGNWQVATVWVALDATPEIVAAACRENVDMLVTHHPLIFKPIKSIDFSSAIGAIIERATRNRLALFAAHTNLDSVQGGVNDVLAARVGLQQLSMLTEVTETDWYKLVVYAPVDYEHKILNAIIETGAGQIGDYSCCTFRNSGTGSFVPADRTKPFVGTVGELNQASEIRIEARVRKSGIRQAVSHIRQVHPYETMAYDLYPLDTIEPSHGIGRIGELVEETELYAFAESIKTKLGLQQVKVAGKAELPVRRAAVCSGSGSSLMKAFLTSRADVYISGDMHYHDALAIVDAGRGLVDIGHFVSENLIVEVLAHKLKEALMPIDPSVAVEACGLQRDVFYYV